MTHHSPRFPGVESPRAATIATMGQAPPPAPAGAHRGFRGAVCGVPGTWFDPFWVLTGAPLRRRCQSAPVQISAVSSER